MNRNKILFFFFLFAFSNIVFAQHPQFGKGSAVNGIIVDSLSNAPIEYANIILYNSSDSSQVKGTVTDKNGKFNLIGIRPGKYYLDIQFMGYNKKRINNVNINSLNRNIDLESILISPAAINLKNVVVEGNRSPVTYQIDKKVIDVSKMPTVVSGNATDVLENVPSVTVDVDGNVSLRGSTSFTVLIDGRPSVMDAQDALQQIPASSIETIEIITNPSAKYDPEGTAGIINIKLKKNRNLGLSGIINANAGINDKYGGDFIFEYKTPSVNYNFGLNYSKRFFPGSSIKNQQFGSNQNIAYLNSNGNNERGRNGYGIRGGMEFNLGMSDFLGWGGRYGYRKFQHNDNLNYLQWSDANPAVDSYSSKNNRWRAGNYYAFNLNYNHKFDPSGHQISSEFFVSHDNGDEATISQELSNNIQTDGRRTTEEGPGTEYREKIDYTLPLGEKRKIEAGSQGEIRLSKDINKYYLFNPSNGIYEFQSLFSNSTDYNRSELALYTIYADEWNGFGFQAGARTEYTYRTIKLEVTNQEYSIDRWDFFPSVHSSYKFSGGSQVMASYTRRIDRPRGWYLEPFLTWMDANNVRVGNPALLPEYIDSYEAGFQTFLGDVTFSNDFYYRLTHNVIDRVRSAYSDLVTLNSMANVGKDYSLGAEFMLTFNPVSFWDLNLMGNIYDYRIKGSLENVPFERKSFNWNMRANNGFKITSSTLLQVNVRYNSPSVSSQGRNEGFFSTDAALKQDVFQKKISLTLQVRDLFGTAKHEFTSTGINYYSYNYYTHESPMVMFNIRFNFNNYKDGHQDRNNMQQNGDNNNEDQF